MNSLYLILDGATLVLPLALSFDKRVEFYTYWRHLLVGIVVMMSVFIPWDIIFTKNGVWGFNPDYLIGLNILGLPLEEWLFFVCVPYACVFIYLCTIHYIHYDINLRAVKIGALVYAFTILLLGLVYLDHLYTSVTFLGTSAYLLYHILVRKSAFLGQYFIAYLIALLPFFVVNGILTGAATPEPVVWYNDAENMGIRLLTIPVEDTVYAMLMFLLTVSVFEKSQCKARRSAHKDC